MLMMMMMMWLATTPSQTQIAGGSDGRRVKSMALFGLSTGNLLLAGAKRSGFCEFDTKADDVLWVVVEVHSNGIEAHQPTNQPSFHSPRSWYTRVCVCVDPQGLLAKIDDPWAYCRDPAGLTATSDMFTPQDIVALNDIARVSGTACYYDNAGRQWLPTDALTHSVQYTTPRSVPLDAAALLLTSMRRSAVLAGRRLSTHQRDTGNYQNQRMMMRTQPAVVQACGAP